MHMFVNVQLLLSKFSQVAAGNTCEQDANFLSFPTWYKYLNPSPLDGCTPVIGSLTDFWLIIAAVIEILLRLGVLLAVGFIIWGSWRLITSQGDPNGVKDARGTILNAIIGLLIAIFAVTAIHALGTRFN